MAGLVGAGAEFISLSPDEYTVGWITALPLELAAATAMLDLLHESRPVSSNDTNTYTLGNIGTHNIVISCLPSDHYGTNNAAIVASNMHRSFPRIETWLMIGIGGGVPRIPKADLRLGDVVVSTQVFQYDFGKTLADGQSHVMSLPQRPSQALMTTVSQLRARHELNVSRMTELLLDVWEKYPKMAPEYRRPPAPDRLFKTAYNHADPSLDCDFCDQSMAVPRERRSEQPRIHYGTIASGNQVIKDSVTRDKLAEQHNVLCFEMEAAGFMDILRCLVVRGICDYADSHKNKAWQKYAAVVAAAYAKELVLTMPGNEGAGSQRSRILPESQRKKLFMDSLGYEKMDTRHDAIKPAHTKTCEWLLHHQYYEDWIHPNQYDDHRGFFWITGKPGAGKSTLVKYALSQTRDRLRSQSEVEYAIISYFFHARGGRLERSVEGMYRSLLGQLLRAFPVLLTNTLHQYEALRKRPIDSMVAEGEWDLGILQVLLTTVVEKLGSRTLVFFIDALDECDQEEIQDMIEFFFEALGDTAARVSGKFFIFFSSRHYPHLELPTIKLQLTLEHQPGHDADLEEYVRSKLRTGSSSARQDISTSILGKSAGIFMWVVLVVEILNTEFRRGRMFAVKKRLDELPTDLSELFKDIITKDQHNMDDFLLCIQWLLFAQRPLSREEFYYAMISGLEPSSETLEPWDPNYISMDDIERFILSSSKGLAETQANSKTVQFIHESVQDFLLRDNGIASLWPAYADSVLFKTLSHERLKKCCEFYMKADSSGVERGYPHSVSTIRRKLPPLSVVVLEAFPFLYYAHDHVFYHTDYVATDPSRRNVWKNSTIKRWYRIHPIFDPDNPKNHPDYGKTTNILSQPENLSLHSVPALSPLSPITKARNNQNMQPSPDLLHQELEFEEGYESYSLLLFAAENGYKHLVTSLLSHSKKNINLEDGQGRTPVILAAKNGDKEILRTLLSVPDINLNAQDSRGFAPLHWAVESENLEVVQMLLELPSVDTKLRDFQGRTFLFRAKKDFLRKILMDPGINANLKKRGARDFLSDAKFEDDREIYNIIFPLLKDEQASEDKPPASGPSSDLDGELWEDSLDLSD